MIHLASGDLFANLGSAFTSLAELLTLIGGAIAFVIRRRNNSRRSRSRAEAAATVAASETRRVLEQRVDQQHQEQIEILRAQILEQGTQYKTQLEQAALERAAERDQLRQQIRDLTKDRTVLLERLLNDQEKNQRS